MGSGGGGKKRQKSGEGLHLGLQRGVTFLEKRGYKTLVSADVCRGGNLTKNG